MTTTTRAAEILESHPWEGDVDREALARCIDACAGCAQACTACADACLSEDAVAELRKCIRLDLDCADVCAATERVLTRQTGYDASTSKAQLQACREACSTCAEECRRCESACAELLAAMK